MNQYMFWTESTRIQKCVSASLGVLQIAYYHISYTEEGSCSIKCLCFSPSKCCFLFHTVFKLFNNQSVAITYSSIHAGKICLHQSFPFGFFFHHRKNWNVWIWLGNIFLFAQEDTVAAWSHPPPFFKTFSFLCCLLLSPSIPLFLFV